MNRSSFENQPLDGQLAPGDVRGLESDPRWAQRLAGSDGRRQEAQQGSGPTAQELGCMAADVHDVHGGLTAVLRDALAAGDFGPDYLPLMKIWQMAGKLILDIERLAERLPPANPRQPR